MSFDKRGEEAEDVLSTIIGCTPTRLESAHLAEMRALIKELPQIAEEGAANEKNLERFEKLIQLYSDEPQMLDPVLPEFVQSLLPHIQWPSSSSLPLCAISHTILVRLRALSTVRGYEFLMRFLPHEIELLESVLIALEYFSEKLDQCSASNAHIDKRIVHILAVWLLIICKNPFNLARIAVQPSQSRFTERAIICLDSFQRELVTVGELSVVPTLLAQILNRNADNREQLAPRFDQFQRVFAAFESEKGGGQTLISQLKLSIAILKWGRRQEVRPFALALLRSLSPIFLRAQCANILVRNFVAKLLQRIALVLLAPKLAEWRYRCGLRSLEENLRGRATAEPKDWIASEPKKAEEGTNRAPENGDSDNEEQCEHLDEVEVLLGELLLKVCDRDNMVRWTAARGVARICARIPLHMAAEVVAAVMKSCFGDGEDASAWHGGCLALAELCRRGCLLPEQVPKVINEVLSRALVFEQVKLGFMLAVNVRDAACYICWAFARAYEASILLEHLRPLAGTLISAALFDREVNVRRAASAAFQENVGRNDSFPHGIRILPLIDYIEVARIRHCYLELSTQVARYGEYVRPMLDHLCELKCAHWDEQVRELGAEALGRLAPFDSQYAFENTLPSLCARIDSKDPGDRHGALFGVSALLIALHAKGHPVLNFRDRLLSAVSAHSAALDSHRVKGFGLTGKSLCRLIRALCSIGCELGADHLAQFHDILDVAVGESANPQMVRCAADAFTALMAYYGGGERPIGTLLSRIRRKYFAEIEGICQSESLRCSCIIPLGHVHASFFVAPFDGSDSLGDAILRRLVDVIRDANTPKWVYARVAAIRTICAVLAGYSPPTLQWDALLQCLVGAADDYTATTNGDIGRFARREAIKALGRLLPLVYSLPTASHHHSSPPIARAQLDLAIGKIIERACESIDDLREKASTVLGHLVQPESGALSAAISERDLLRSVFVIRSGAANGAAVRRNQEEQEEHGPPHPPPLKEAQCPTEGNNFFSAVDWRHALGFGRLAPLLDSATYGRCALAGFVLSAGSVSTWTSQNAFLAVAAHLRPHKRDTTFMDTFLAHLCAIHAEICARQGDPSPVLVLFRMLLNDGQLQRLEAQPDEHPPFVALCDLAIQLAVAKGRPKVKTLAVTVLGSLLQLDAQSALYGRVLRLLLSLLDSPYGSLREQAAEQLFETFSLLAAEGDGPIGQALELLAQTDWGGRHTAREQLTRVRQRISRLLTGGTCGDAPPEPEETAQ